MGVPTSEVGYTIAMSRREDHEVHKGHVVVLEKKKKKLDNSKKVMFAPRTGHKVPDGEQRYNSTLSSASALNDEWVVNAMLQPLYTGE